MKAIASLVLAIALGAPAVVHADEAKKDDVKPLKVLMIGNSFSMSVMQQTPQIAKAMGCKLDICSLYIGGCPLSRHAANLKTDGAQYGIGWNYQGNVKTNGTAFGSVVVHPKGKDGKEKPCWNANLRKVIAVDKWDIVTIQQASHESWKADSYHPHVDELIAAIRELAPQAEIRVQQTWSYCNADKRICDQAKGGPGQWGVDRRGMYEKLTENYSKLAKDNNFKLIPTGLAVENFRESEKIDGWKGDVVGSIKENDKGEAKGDAIHLNGKGHYLQGLVWTGALFGVDVSKCTYKPKFIDEELAEKIRAAAAKALAAPAL